jgi:CCR4-NOT transcription complex subunit 7/8
LLLLLLLSCFHLRCFCARSATTTTDVIRHVWADNFEEEMLVIRECVAEYPFIAMDTEFPGVVARPMGTFLSSTDYHYQTLRTNVDLLKVRV